MNMCPTYEKKCTHFKNDNPELEGTNQCFGGLLGSFASVFPNPPSGPIWEMGFHPCDVNELDFDGSNPSNFTGKPAVKESCIKKLYGIKDSDDLEGGNLSQITTSSWKHNRSSKKFQMVNIIEPYSRKQGCPNFGFMEGVAYVLEGLGKILLNAPSCQSGFYPDYIGALGRNAWCQQRDNSMFNKDTGEIFKSESIVKCDTNNFSECQENIEKWKNMIKSKEMGGIQLIAENAWESEFAVALNVESIPRFVLLDQKGNIINIDAPRPSTSGVDIKTGEQTEGELNKELIQLIEKHLK